MPQLFLLETSCTGCNQKKIFELSWYESSQFGSNYRAQLDRTSVRAPIWRACAAQLGNKKYELGAFSYTCNTRKQARSRLGPDSAIKNEQQRVHCRRENIARAIPPAPIYLFVYWPCSSKRERERRADPVLDPRRATWRVPTAGERVRTAHTYEEQTPPYK